MRSSKSRSRNKSRNQRSLGNVVNRVFDSSGPEGKVRGTPQQIIEKYLALARDAQLSNDRVAEQSFLQHAEHYTRMLAEAQREMAERQAQFGHQQGNGEEREDRQFGGNERRDDNRRDDRRDDNRDDNRQGEQGEQRNDERRDNRDNRRNDNRNERNDRRDDRRERPAREPQPQPDHHDSLPEFLRAPIGIPEPVSVEDGSALVETPEARTEPEAAPAAPAPVEAAEAEAPRPRRRAAAPRKPAKPKASKDEPAADPEAS